MIHPSRKYPLIIVYQVPADLLRWSALINNGECPSGAAPPLFWRNFIFDEQCSTTLGRLLHGVLQCFKHYLKMSQHVSFPQQTLTLCMQMCSRTQYLYSCCSECIALKPARGDEGFFFIEGAEVVSYYFLHPFYPHVDLREQWHSLRADTLLFVWKSAPGIRFPVFPVSSVSCYSTLESAKELWENTLCSSFTLLLWV